MVLQRCRQKKHVKEPLLQARGVLFHFDWYVQAITATWLHNFATKKKEILVRHMWLVYIHRAVWGKNESNMAKLVENCVIPDDCTHLKKKGAERVKGFIHKKLSILPAVLSCLSSWFFIIYFCSSIEILFMKLLALRPKNTAQ